jgi:phosphoribosylformimino-5-aminoimidazole carboxamide ribotide isomerase
VVGSVNLVGVFRPCIDLHEGRVKQIVGSSLSDDERRTPTTNFVADHDAAWYAALFCDDGLIGGHVIQLGPGNEAEARAALAAFPNGLQLGGGVTADNAAEWLEAGASHVIATSWLFEHGRLSMSRLEEIEREVGRDRLVIDLSCRRRGDEYVVVTDRWQRWSDLRLDRDTLAHLGEHCDEFLVHGVDVEGFQRGMDTELVDLLAAETTVFTTYAGGARSLEDLRYVAAVGRGRLGLTIGSAMDLFGGTGVRYQDIVAWAKNQTDLG